MAVEPRHHVLALIYPLEQHVGHWACSSPAIRVTRVLMQEDMRAKVAQAVSEHIFTAVAVVGKRQNGYLDVLDEAARAFPALRRLPYIYRCQNTNLAQQLNGRLPTLELLASLSHWVESASDRRYSLVLAQSLQDCGLLRAALAPTRVVACPYGFDPTLFEPGLPEKYRPVDVGCYFSLKSDPGRQELARRAEAICRERGWTFRFRTGVYGQEYARLIRETKICLHRSLFSEIPYRLYEVACLGGVLVTDPLKWGAETLFEEGREYLTYRPDFGDLEGVIAGLLENRDRWQAVSRAGKARAGQYTWPAIAERYVAPALDELRGTS
jgi:hypothetical protein